MFTSWCVEDGLGTLELEKAEQKQSEVGLREASGAAMKSFGAGSPLGA